MNGARDKNSSPAINGYSFVAIYSTQRLAQQEHIETESENLYQHFALKKKNREEEKQFLSHACPFLAPKNMITWDASVAEYNYFNLY